MKRNIITFITLACVASAVAIEPVDSARLNFPQSHSELITTFGDNEQHLKMMTEKMARLTAGEYPLYRVDSIRIVGGASPEGSTAINDTLSHRRASTIFNYFRPVIPDGNVATSFSFLGRDWEGLRALVEADENVPFRDEVLTLLADDPSSMADDGAECLSQLKSLHNGIPYRYMYARLFPSLRESSIYVDYSGVLTPFSGLLPSPVIDEDVTDFSYTLIPIKGNSSSASNTGNFYMALKSNLLYDALLLPSISAEFYLGKNFSAVANWTYGWWDNDHRHRYWRAYGGDIALRKWFGKAASEKPLTGHHLGIYGGIFTYDFEFGGKGYMGGLPGRPLWDRCLLNAGVEYGYSLPIARRLNIDLTIGLGVIYGKYIKYTPEGNGYHYQSTHHLSWIGPAKAEISLVWLIGKGNFNKGKGGKR